MWERNVLKPICPNFRNYFSFWERKHYSKLKKNPLICIENSNFTRIQLLAPEIVKGSEKTLKTGSWFRQMWIERIRFEWNLIVKMLRIFESFGVKCALGYRSPNEMFATCPIPMSIYDDLMNYLNFFIPLKPRDLS